MAGTHTERLAKAGRDTDEGRETLLTALADDAFVAALCVDPDRTRQMNGTLFRLQTASASEVAAFASVGEDEAERYLDSRDDVCEASGPPGAPGRVWWLVEGGSERLWDDIRNDPAIDPAELERDRGRLSEALANIEADLADAETGDPDFAFVACLVLGITAARRGIARLREAGAVVDAEERTCEGIAGRLRDLRAGRAAVG